MLLTTVPFPLSKKKKKQADQAKKQKETEQNHTRTAKYTFCPSLAESKHSFSFRKIQ